MIFQARDISLRYGNRVALQPMSFQIPAGNITVILGKNGAGKSSLLKVLAGILPADSGQVRVKDQLLEELPLQDRAQSLAYMPQVREVAWRLSVRNILDIALEVASGRSEDPAVRCKRIDAMLGKFDLSDLAHRSWDSLSGGEQARVSLARALMTNPEVLLADEPLAGLDIVHQLDSILRFRMLAEKGMGIVLVLHDLRLARICADHALLLKDGTLLDCGLSANVLSEEGLSRCFDTPIAFGATMSNDHYIC